MKKKPKRLVGGPFLASAVFCENVFESEDKSMNAIRIHDGTIINVPHDAPADLPSEEKPIPVQKLALISFRTGDKPGKHDLKVVAESPSGKKTVVTQGPLEFMRDPHSGVSIRAELRLLLHLAGTYWFDVILDGKRLTRMPLDVKIVRLPASEAGKQVDDPKANLLRKR